MSSLSRVFCVLICLIYPVISPASAGAVTNAYVEDFATKQYCDTLNTTAWWDTIIGEIKLAPFELSLKGSYFAGDYIDGVAVLPEARGHGIGTRLLDEALAIARESGKRWVRLHVVDTNPRAQALYERLGYRVTKVEPTRWMSGVLGFGAMIAMERQVEGGAGTGPTAEP